MPSLFVFDVDGTLVKSFMRDGDERPHAYDLVQVLPGRLSKIDGLAQAGARFALATNQAGASLGYQTFDQVRAKMGAVCAALHHFFGRPYSVHIAFEHPKARDPAWREDPRGRRKPGPGLLNEAMAAHAEFPSSTVFIGDMDVDKHAAIGAGVPFIHADDFFSLIR